MNEPIKLIEKILSEAKAVADAEKKNADDKAKEILDKAKQKAKDATEKAEANASAEAEERKKRIKSVYDLEHKKDILAMKREVLDAAFSKAEADIAKLPDGDFCALMTRLLLDCADDGTGEICVAKADTNRLGDDFLKKANDALKAKCGKGDVALAKDTCGKKSGFIYRKGGMEIDCSVEAVVNLAREQVETDAAAILFGEGEKN
ncbi:MAG: V-type ATP synthase subunit E family protein [Eubacteriales bacterium]